MKAKKGPVKEHGKESKELKEPMKEPPPTRVNRRAFLKGSAVAGASAGAYAATTSIGLAGAHAQPPQQTPTVIYHASASVDAAPNPIVAENQMAGTPDWGLTQLYYDIEGYASESSVAPGDTITFFVNTPGPSFDMLIYRAGYYGGVGARLVAEVRGLLSVVQPPPTRDDMTGFASCLRWSPAHQLTVPDTWVSGIYFVKLVRPDTGGEACIYFTVRENEAARQRRGSASGRGRGSDLLFQQSVSTYQAYNPYGGKSLYHFNSSNCQTVSEGPRAVKVSLDRPYLHPLYGQNHFFLSEFPMVYWLEAQGYDVSYCTSLDTHASGKPGATNLLLDHRTFLSVGHDEYWSQEIRDAITAARDNKVNIAFLSSNTGYWRVRFEPDPESGRADRVMVCYKTIESGAEDPVSPTTTWRDPRVNQPENSLLGIQYIGDNDNHFFPIRVLAEQGQDRIYRHTALANMPPGEYTDIGHRLLGWEWDAVVDNGAGPDNLTVLASTPTFGNILEDAGSVYITSKAVTNIVRYIAASGATVLSVGTNQWAWGLAMFDTDQRLQQITCNILADLGALPATPDRSLVLDATAAANASAHIYIDGTQPELDFVRSAPHAKFGLPLDVPSKDDKDTAPAPSTTDPVISNIDFVTDRTSAVIMFETDVETIAQVWMRIEPTKSDYRLSAALGWRLPMAAAGVSEPYAKRHQVAAQWLDPGQTYYVTIIAADRTARVTIATERRLEMAPGTALNKLTYAVRTMYRSLPCWVRENWSSAAVWLGAVAVASGVMWRLRRMRGKRDEADGASRADGANPLNQNAQQNAQKTES